MRLKIYWTGEHR